MNIHDLLELNPNFSPPPWQRVQGLVQVQDTVIVVTDRAVYKVTDDEQVGCRIYCIAYL